MVDELQRVMGCMKTDYEVRVVHREKRTYKKVHKRAAWSGIVHGCPDCIALLKQTIQGLSRGAQSHG